MNRNDTEVAAAAFTTVISKDVRFLLADVALRSL